MIRLTEQKCWIKRAGYAALALAACASSAFAQQFALKDGDTVVFYGDSITAQRLYTRDVEEFLLTRYPKLHLRFVNAGVPGDSVKGGYAGTLEERVKRDVVPLHPAMITVMLGMNDGGWGEESPEIDTAFQKGYRGVLAALRKAAPDAGITVICPTPYDEISHGTEFPGYSRVIDRFADDVSQIGTQLRVSGDKQILVADFHRPLTDALQQAKTNFPQLAPLIVPDRIHPSETGHWIIATALMSAWHVNPTVSSLTLNAVDSQVLDKDRTTVTDVEKSADGLKWTQLDGALPLPLDFNNAMTPMLLAISNIAQLDQMMLRVESLAPGQYQLSIDGKAITAFSHEELHHGVNLALFKTPMLQQARGIDSTEDQISALDRARFILTTDVKEGANSVIAEATLQDAEDQLEAAIRKDLDPKPHHVELHRK
jgi:lysophospholipase L1-like esterase